MSNTCTYFVVLNSPLIVNRCACGSYEQARIKLASTLTAFARQGVEVLGHINNHIHKFRLIQLCGDENLLSALNVSSAFCDEFGVFFKSCFIHYISPKSLIKNS